MLRLRLATLTLVPLLACVVIGDSDTSNATTTATTSGTATTTGDSTAVTTTMTTASSTGPGSTTGDPPTTGDPSTTSTDTNTTGAESSTGEAPFCNGWQTADGEPFLELYNKPLELLANGSTLPLECGGQGLFMFGLYAEFGGFTPASENIDFAVTVDVDGFNNNPEGHFYSADPVGFYVGCQPFDGGVPGVIPVFPLDNLDDLTALDGKPASIHVVMHTGGADVAVDLNVVLAVQKDDSWAFCGG